MRRVNLLLSVLLIGLAAYLALRKLNYPLIGIDDANIYFVYARNFAYGHGFVYNIGGERVEGFTSLLWTLIAALVYKISSRPELTLLVINITLVGFGIAVALDYLQTIALGGESPGVRLLWSAIFLLVLFTSPRYVVWNTITLMENGLWSSLLLITAIYAVRDHPSPGSVNYGFIPLLILLLLTRPESMLWVVVFILILYLRMAFKEGFGTALKVIWPSILSAGLTLLSLILFRMAYFGYPFPNTYYAKVSRSLSVNLENGTIYLIRYFLSDPIAAIIVIIVLAGCLYTILRIFKRKIPDNEPFFLSLIAGTGLLMPVLTGGDHFGSFRFYQNIYPIALLYLILTAHQILSHVTQRINFPQVRRVNQVFFSVSLLFLVALGYYMTQRSAWAKFSSEIYGEFKIAQDEREKGAFIHTFFSSLPELPSIGVGASGGIKYSYPGEIVDLLGLNNTIMAHNNGRREGYKNHAAFEVETFYQLEPDMVLPQIVDHGWKYDEVANKKLWTHNFMYRGLFDEARFLKIYTYARVDSNAQGQNGMALVAWFRKEFLDSLKSAEFTIQEYKYSP